MLRINLKNLKLNLNIKSLLKVVLIMLLRGCNYDYSSLSPTRNEKAKSYPALVATFIDFTWEN